MSDQFVSAERMIAARLERLPISGWHIRVSTLLGIAIFFDAFDLLALAYVLPVLAGQWHIAPPQIGSLIAIGNAGQAIGALGCGIIAERYGRVTTAQWTIVIFALMKSPPAPSPPITTSSSGAASCKASVSAVKCRSPRPM